MIADEQEERFRAGVFRGTMDGVTVAQWRGLFDELHPPRVNTGGCRISWAAAGADDHGDFLNARVGDLFDQDGQRGFGNAVAINESLERKRLLILASGGNDGLADIHVCTFELSRG